MADSDSDAELACLNPGEYTVGWICALPSELQAARAMLDERHRMLQGQPKHDSNNYVLGRIKQHNTVIANLPFYGTDRAAVVANNMQSTFPRLRFVLMVGIGGGVHSNQNDIRLGDIVVSYPDGQGGGVIQYDLGREETSEFRRVGHLNAPPNKVIKIVEDTTRGIKEPMSEWTYPDTERNVLFQSTFNHIEGNHDCNQCIKMAVPTDIVQFRDRQTTYPRIFYGNIGSGNTVMKSAIKRDLISRKDNVICFEMEAAGIMHTFPCLVIRGISDYADSHKNKAWQPYAAVVAAAYAKRLLQRISTQAVEEEKTIKGIPGAGKTIITSVVVEELLSLFRNDTSIGVAFVYCDVQRKDEQKAEDLLASLLKQLCQRQSSLPEAMKALYTSHKSRQTRPSLDELSRILKGVILRYARTFIIVDALDECQHEERFVTEILAIQYDTGSNLFATSRPIKTIEQRFNGCLSLDIKASDEDVKAYVENRILELRLLREDNKDLHEIRKSELKANIKSQVIESVHGMFLLARFHLDSLTDKTTPKEIINALQKLPTGLNAYDEAYGKTIKRISNQQPGFRHLARRVLLWLTCTERPLTTLELRHALAMKTSITTLDQDDFESTSVMVDPEVNEIAAADAQREIAIACVAYLSLEAFRWGCCETNEEYEGRHATYSFFEYASINWGHHARKASFPLGEVMSFLRCSESLAASSQVLAGIEEIQQELYGGLPVEIPGLHLAAFFGIVKAMKDLAEEDPSHLDICSRTPLFYAAARGHDAVVELLLDMDEDRVDSEDEDGQTPLMRAAENGHDMVIQRLLRTGNVDINHKDKLYR
ncbi:hypothetical protein DER46DRAFT_698966 [Fusarium sp. MPI-SDFR-AT-0072]|nr:hypothetical protein DER46DRAFT_698966 [Fusarium sp. MPI-SDFR-AT-0072]